MARRKPRAFDTAVYRRATRLARGCTPSCLRQARLSPGLRLRRPLSAAWLLNSFWLGREQDKDGGGASASITSARLGAFSGMGTIHIEMGWKCRGCAHGFLSAERIGRGGGNSSVESVLDLRVGNLIEEGSDGCE